MTGTHETFIRKTIELAEQAMERSNEPFGALLVCDGEILLTAESTRFTEHDVTRHAELNLVSMASQELSPETLARSILYSSSEPCAMCAAAIYWAGIPTLVYGWSAEKVAEINGSTFCLPSREVFARGKRPTEVIGPILEDEALKTHQKHWNART
ncbi:MAG: nucleoside deaminase [Anaerolineaceae bacterium]|nr:nucleoside deaminase [Anaerolineaceae bacterium]